MAGDSKRGIWMLSALLVFAALGSASERLLAQNPPAGQYDPVDIQYGARIFSTQCALCHGANGDLVSGVDLRGDIRRAPTDAALRGLLTSGIAGTAMPAFKFDASELTMIVAYVRNMRNADAGAVNLGDATRGRGLFEGAAGCAGCHRVNGTGPRVAPDLSDIGSTRSAAALQRTLTDPNGAIAPATRSVRAITREGKVVVGRRLNEDTHTVQLIDEQERLVSLVKTDLREYKVIMTSGMPSYKDKLRAQELADVIAYLLSLKGISS